MRVLGKHDEAADTFISPNVLNVLVEDHGVSLVSMPETDLAEFCDGLRVSVIDRDACVKEIVF